MKKILITPLMAVALLSAVAQDKKSKKVIIDTDNDNINISVNGTAIMINGDTIVSGEEWRSGYNNAMQELSLAKNQMNQSLAQEMKSAKKELKAAARELSAIDFGDFRFPDMDLDMAGFTFSSNTRLGVYTQKDEKGAKITGLAKGSPAASVFEKGDIITKVDKTAIDSPSTLSNIIQSKKAGETVNIHFLRNGKKKSEKVVLQERTSNTVNFFSANNPVALGAEVQETENDNGLTVLKVTKDLLGDKAGLKEGDIITDIQGEKVNNISDIRKVLRNQKNRSTYTINVIRNGKEKALTVEQPVERKRTTL